MVTLFVCLIGCIFYAAYLGDKNIDKSEMEPYTITLYIRGADPVVFKNVIRVHTYGENRVRFYTGDGTLHQISGDYLLVKNP